MATPDHYIFGRYMQFNLTLAVDWRVKTAANKRQVEIDNVHESSRQVTHEYAIGNLVYVEMNCIYHKQDYIKQEPYITI